MAQFRRVGCHPCPPDRGFGRHKFGGGGTFAAVATEADSTEAKLRRLQALRDEALHAGSEKAVERQSSQGKLLARERAEKVLDPASFVELDRYVRHREAEFGMRERRPYGDAVVTGYGP